MADLRVDLVNHLIKEKEYEEMELVRLAQDPNMIYRDKIEQMSFRLANLATLNAQIGLAQQYFGQPAPTPQVASVQQQPTGQLHPGQTHGE